MNRIQEYNEKNKSYNITGIKKYTPEQLDYIKLNSAQSLDELYKNYSDIKRSSYNDIINTYKPREIISLRGSCFSYSVILIASNNDILHITKANNYLIEVSK
jgi:hypothetical protein